MVETEDMSCFDLLGLMVKNGLKVKQNRENNVTRNTHNQSFEM
jgi:hypothetical protein